MPPVPVNPPWSPRGARLPHSHFDTHPPNSFLLEEGISEEPSMPAWPASQSMKMIPLRWRGVGVGCYRRAGPPLKTEAFFPLPRGDFQRLANRSCKFQFVQGFVL